MVLNTLLDDHRAAIDRVRELSYDYRAESITALDPELKTKLKALESSTSKLAEILDAQLTFVFFTALSVVIGFALIALAIGLFWSWGVGLLVLGLGLLFVVGKAVKASFGTLSEKKGATK